MSDTGARGILAGHQYIWQPGTTANAPVLLLLHGTGGDEESLLPMVPMIAAGAAVLSPRGNVMEQGAPRFFRRLAEGVFDMEDLHRRTGELGAFVDVAARQHGFDRGRVFAVGYSNGANVAASLMFTRPHAFAGAVLLRAMLPFEPEGALSMKGIGVLLLAGRMDPIVPQAQVERLAQLMRDNGAEVELDWQSAGHQLGPADVTRARQWLAPRLSA